MHKSKLILLVVQLSDSVVTVITIKSQVATDEIRMINNPRFNRKYRITKKASENIIYVCSHSD